MLLFYLFQKAKNPLFYENTPHKAISQNATWH